MSKTNDDDIWGEVDSPGNTGAAEPDIPIDDSMGDGPVFGEDQSSKPVDVEARPKKQFKVIYVIALIGLMGVSFFGYIGFSMYQKIYGGAESSEMAGGAALVDTAAVLPLSPQQSPKSEESTQFGSLPVGGGTSPSDVPPVADATLVAAVEQLASVSPVEPAVPAAPSVASAAPVCPVALAPVCPSISASEPTQVKSPVKRPAYKKQSQTRSAVAKKSIPSPTPEPAKVPEGVESKLGRLSGFTVLAIEPKTGDHQQAWVRDAAGKMFIVREGDSIQGARVTSVRFSDGIVQTVAGDIRK